MPVNQGYWTEHLTNDAQQLQDVFMDWLSPQQKEERQMGQQLIMEQLIPVAKMQGMKEAGINPLFAASGISGSSSSYQPPAASSNPIGDVASAASDVLGGVESGVGAVSQLFKLRPEIDNIKSDTASNLADIGLTDAQTQGVLTDNSYKDEDWQSRLNVQRQQFDNMKQEFANMRQIHEQILSEIEKNVSIIEANHSLAEYQEVMKLKVQEEERWLKAQNDFRINHKLYITDSGIDGYIFSMVESGASMEQFNKFIDVYSGYREKAAFAEQKGRSRAERLFGSSKSPWELGDKYLHRFVDWIHSNGEDNPEVMYEQISDIAERLQLEHPDWDRDRIIKELYSFGFSNDEVYKAFK